MSNELFISLLRDGSLAIPQRGDRKTGESILYWAELYWNERVAGGPKGTQQAKKDDLQTFLTFYAQVCGDVRIDYWTPSVSKSFKAWLQKTSPRKPARKYAKAYAPTSINRMLATLRHFARFIQEQRPFSAGFPFEGVKDLVLQAPEWNGLSDIDVMRLHSALDQICQLQTRANQRPGRNRATFVVALHTGLRASELVGLEFSQYQGKYLKNVRGKGDQFDDIYLSAEARRVLDEYIAGERGSKDGPLFLTNRNGRLSRQQIDDFFKQLTAQANAKLPKDEWIHLHAHKLRHTSVKRVHDERGPLAAKKFSRHRSFQQLERYATQTREEHERMVDELFD
jgi:integrase/recombinase XerD